MDNIQARPPTTANKSNVDVRFFIDLDRDSLCGCTDEITQYVMQASWDLGAQNVESRTGFDGQASLVLNNESGIFTPSNVNSPFYGKILAGIPIAIEYRQDDEWIRLWTGYVVSWKYNAQANQADTVRVQCSQTFRVLDLEGIQIPLLENKNSGELITELVTANKYFPPFASAFFLDQSRLDQQGLGDPSTQIVLGTSTIDYAVFGFDLNNQSSLREALEQIAEAEVSLIFLDRYGRFNFVGYANFIASTIVDDLTESDVLSMNYTYADPFYNTIEVEFAPKSLKTNTEFINTEVTVEAQSTLETTLIPEKNGQTEKIIIKEITNVNASGGVTCTVVQTTAHDLLIRVVNTSSSSVTTTIKIRGDYYESLTEASVNEQDTDSILKHRKEIRLRKTSGLLSTEIEARRVAQRLKLRYSESVGYFNNFRVGVNKKEKFKLLETGKAITLSNQRLYADQLFHMIIGESGTWTPQNLEITYYTELLNRVGAFVLDQTHLDSGIGFRNVPVGVA